MLLCRRGLICTFAAVLIVGAYYAGGYTAGLLTVSAHAIAPTPKPISIEIAERVAAN